MFPLRPLGLSLLWSPFYVLLGFTGLNIYFSTGIATDMSVWEGVVVTPSDKAYEKPEKEDEEKEEENGEEPMESQDE